MSREILISPKFGAGWSTWAGGDDRLRNFMLTYKPLIDALKAGEKLLIAGNWHDLDSKATIIHSALKQFRQDCEEKFGEVPYLGGARDLTVVRVNGPFKVNEYDGNESIEEGYNEFIDPETL